LSLDAAAMFKPGAPPDERNTIVQPEDYGNCSLRTGLLMRFDMKIVENSYLRSTNDYNRRSSYPMAVISVLAVIACGVGMLVNRDTPETYHFFAMALAFNGSVAGGMVLSLGISSFARGPYEETPILLHVLFLGFALIRTESNTGLIALRMVTMMAFMSIYIRTRFLRVLAINVIFAALTIGVAATRGTEMAGTETVQPWILPIILLAVILTVSRYRYERQERELWRQNVQMKREMKLERKQWQLFMSSTFKLVLSMDEAGHVLALHTADAGPGLLPVPLFVRPPLNASLRSFVQEHSLERFDHFHGRLREWMQSSNVDEKVVRVVVTYAAEPNAGAQPPEVEGDWVVDVELVAVTGLRPEGKEGILVGMREVGERRPLSDHAFQKVGPPEPPRPPRTKQPPRKSPTPRGGVEPKGSKGVALSPVTGDEVNLFLSETEVTNASGADWQFLYLDQGSSTGGPRSMVDGRAQDEGRSQV
jgi:hypothetical protein